jgi:hypothetical protein
LWIPYTLMAVGMWLTALQCLVQIVAQVGQLSGRGQGDAS